MAIQRLPRALVGFTRAVPSPARGTGAQITGTRDKLQRLPVQVQRQTFIQPITRQRFT